MPTPLTAAIAASLQEPPRDHTRDSFLTRASFLVNKRLLARESSQATSQATPKKNLARGTFLVSCTTGLAASTAALAATIPTTSTTGDPGHDDGPHNNGFINAASMAGATCTSADKAGTFPVDCTTGLPASAAALAAMIPSRSTTSNPGHDDGPHDDRFIDAASTAGATCTSVNKAGTFMVGCTTGPAASAATLASTISTTATPEAIPATTTDPTTTRTSTWPLLPVQHVPLLHDHPHRHRYCSSLNDGDDINSGRSRPRQRSP